MMVLGNQMFLRARPPSLCELCRRWAHAALCDGCTARHAQPRPRCARCGLPTGVAVVACGECLRDSPPYASTTVAVDYTYPWDRVVSELKFRGRAELARPLALLMLKAWDRGSLVAPDLVCAVPASPLRLRERGYNQAWELATHVAQLMHWHARASVLHRVLEVPHQIELSRALRLANLRAAFVVAADEAALVRRQRVMLIDDVMTTGATAREASACLMRAGAASVDMLVFARTEASRVESD